MSHILISHCLILFWDPGRQHHEVTVILRIWYKTMYLGP
jgi:hypothetical protein